MNQQPDTRPQPPTQPPYQSPAPPPSFIQPPQGMQYMTLPPAPKKKNRRKLVIIVAAVLLLVAGTAAAVWLTVFHVSAADYAQARSALDETKTAYDKVADDLTAAINADSESVSATNERTDTLKKDLDSYTQKFESIQSLHALQDKDIKQKYDAVAEKNKDFIQYASSFATALPLMNEASRVCSDSQTADTTDVAVAELVATYDKAFKPCNDGLDKVTKAGNASLAEFAKSIRGVNDLRRKALVDIAAALNAKDSTAYEAAKDELTAALAKYSDITTQKLLEAKQAASAADQLSSLEATLKDK